MYILGIESSCDETAAAVLYKDQVRSNIVSSQVKIHKKFGGVVPEFASRYHLDFISEVVKASLEKAKVELKDLNLVAVTRGPGLKGSLLIGAMFARSLACSLDIPVLGINHLEAHLLAPFIGNKGLKFPFIGLLVSGGHTSLFYVEGFGRYVTLGQTVDDAVGEAFDKVASILNLGYPGGPVIEKFSQQGDIKAFNFPRPMLKKNNFDFSFSGIKTAVLYEALEIKDIKNFKKVKQISAKKKCNIAASFQEAVVDVLVEKTCRAAKIKKVNSIVVAGGVARNRRLREKITEKSSKVNCKVYMPEPILCTDNAAMVAYVGYTKFKSKIVKKRWEIDPCLKLRS